MSLDTTIFGDKTLSNLLEDVYKSSKKREKQIDSIVGEVKSLIENIGDATIIIPILKDLLDVGVKNTDLLIKLGTIVQRIDSAKSSGDSKGFDLAAEELAQLMGEVDIMASDLQAALPPGVEVDKDGV